MKSLWFLDEPMTSSVNRLEIEIKWVRDEFLKRVSWPLTTVQKARQIFSSFRKFFRFGGIYRLHQHISFSISSLGEKPLTRFSSLSLLCALTTLSISLWYTPWIRGNGKGGRWSIFLLSTDPHSVSVYSTLALRTIILLLIITCFPLSLFYLWKHWSFALVVIMIWSPSSFHSHVILLLLSSTNLSMQAQLFLPRTIVEIRVIEEGRERKGTHSQIDKVQALLLLV